MRGLYNIFYFAVSLIYYVLLLEVAQRFQTDSIEIKRKFVHILLGNCWFFALLVPVDWIVLFLFAITLVVINYVSLRTPDGWLAKLDKGREIKSHGIVAYPISLVVLLLISFKYNDLRLGGVGVIPLAFGDGMAALVGKKLNYKPFYVYRSKKSISGCCTMFFVSLILLAFFEYATGLNSDIFVLLCSSFTIALVAMIVEMITPWGLDNISVPTVCVLVYTQLFYQL